MSRVIRLRKKPREDLDGAVGYQLDDDAGYGQFLEFAKWVGELGGTVPYLDEFGALVVSIYPDDSETERYYEFVRGDSFVLYSQKYQEFTVYCGSVTQEFDVVED